MVYARDPPRSIYYSRADMTVPDLLGIGLLGSMQNLVAAGATRTPSALGVHIHHIETIRGKSVATVLKEVESKYPFVGTSLLDIFFPASLRVKGQELEFWRQAMEARLAPNKYGIRLDCLPRPLAKELSVGDKNDWS